jgi:hypothetical protein
VRRKRLVSLGLPSQSLNGGVILICCSPVICICGCSVADLIEVLFLSLTGFAGSFIEVVKSFRQIVLYGKLYYLLA